jgi:hypothetical protein
MTRTVFHAFFSWTAPPVYFRFCANILNTFFLIFFPIVFISKHALHNWFYRLIENWCRNTQSVNNVDIKIKLIRYDPNGVPCFCSLNSATCIFSVWYVVYVLDLHWQQSWDTREKCFLRYREPTPPGYFTSSSFG